MRIRAVAILIVNDKVALIERHRAGRHYFTFPGGGVDEGETVEQALMREIEEELGLQVKIVRKVAALWFNGNRQDYFHVNALSGIFGTGTGEEFVNPQPDDPESGLYYPVWMLVSDLLDNPVMPREMAELVIRSVKEGWPQEPIVIPEDLQ